MPYAAKFPHRTARRVPGLGRTTTGLGPQDGAVREIEGGEPVLTPHLRARRPTSAGARRSQMQYKPGVVLETHCDPLPESRDRSTSLSRQASGRDSTVGRSRGLTIRPASNGCPPAQDSSASKDNARYLRQWLAPGA